MRRSISLLLLCALLVTPGAAWAAGTLAAAGSGAAPMTIEEHDVRVVINNGFARTEVSQRFANPNAEELEALYAFPLPKDAALAELEITAGERTITGEVLPREQAETAYNEERDQGRQAGLATKEGHQRFEVRVAKVPAGEAVRVRFVYYQPLTIDTGVGRYLYPLEEGGTDDAAAAAFWTRNDKVEGPFRLRVDLKSAWPLAAVRSPSHQALASVREEGKGHHVIEVSEATGSLGKDFVLYYRLADDLPGRVELVTHKAGPDKTGTFMLVLTPGLDLGPITSGADYSFILDVSGSMDAKIGALSDAVARTLGELRPKDRFRVVTFNSSARSLTRGWVPATEANVRKAVADVKKLRADGSTNLYDGLYLGLKDLDDDRPTSVILVTDAETNTGVLSPKRFHELLKKQDVRVFGFLMGNSANWPLMETVCKASGGFWAQVSNSDDILGQIMLAKSKIAHEALHDAELSVKGVKVTDTTELALGKIYRGQQIAILGRYRKGGVAKLKLKARRTGRDKTYETVVGFPDLDTENPELERIWAMRRADSVARLASIEAMDVKEAEAVIRDLGVTYQVVTDETAMVAMGDEAFKKRGIDRRNQRRVAVERQAQAYRATRPPVSRRADKKRPMFKFKAPRLGGGGGALDPVSVIAALGLAGFAWQRRRKDS